MLTVSFPPVNLRTSPTRGTRQRRYQFFTFDFAFDFNLRRLRAMLKVVAGGMPRGEDLRGGVPLRPFPGASPVDIAISSPPLNSTATAASDGGDPLGQGMSFAPGVVGAARAIAACCRRSAPVEAGVRGRGSPGRGASAAVPLPLCCPIHHCERIFRSKDWRKAACPRLSGTSL